MQHSERSSEASIHMQEDDDMSFTKKLSKISNKKKGLSGYIDDTEF